MFELVVSGGLTSNTTAVLVRGRLPFIGLFIIFFQTELVERLVLRRLTNIFPAYLIYSKLYFSRTILTPGKGISLVSYLLYLVPKNRCGLLVGPEYQDISLCTTGVVSILDFLLKTALKVLGPFFEPLIAGIASLGRLISAIGVFAGSRPYLFSFLTKRDDVLQEITKSFAHIVSNYEVKSFYEVR